MGDRSARPFIFRSSIRAQAGLLPTVLDHTLIQFDHTLITLCQPPTLSTGLDLLTVHDERQG